ncbi:serine-tRNA ligase [Batrachochytrium salamandrivorans]|nr:serine-tRNA ligase [Batrachochytrium salamandrivorans]
MPIDVNLIREGRGGDVEAVRASERKRNGSKPCTTVDDAIQLDKEWRAILQRSELVREEKNKVVAQVSSSATKIPTPEQREQSKALSLEIAKLEVELTAIAQRRDEAILKIGNVLHHSVPVADKEEDLEECTTSWGEFTSQPGVVPHHQALWMLGAYEPERGSSVAGHRGYYLKGCGVLLNQALINYALDFLIQREFEVVQPPYFMTKNAMKKVSQLSDFEESLYKLEGGDKDNEFFLIATSEQPMCCFHQNETLPLASLPIRYAGYSPCFRKEAGKFGVDTWGIFRVHQFDKVEQFIVCEPDSEQSFAMLERMRENAENFLKSLDLPFKTINVVSGELNLAAAKKYDINAWFPSLKAHKELVSASNCLDYQSRATDTFTVDRDQQKKPVHLLNATLCALTRTICCIVENHQGERVLEDGTVQRGVHIPKILLPYMRGVTFLPFVREERDFAQQKSAAKNGASVAASKPKQTKDTKKTKQNETVVVGDAAEAQPPTKKAPAPVQAEKVVVAVAHKYTVEGCDYPTNIAALAGKNFASVAEYITFLNTQ